MRALVVGLLLALLGQSSAQQANPLLLPERASSRINASVEIARLKTLGVEAYYVKGGEGLAERLKVLMPAHVYMAYFGDRSHAEVRTQFNRNIKKALRYDKKPSLMLQPALVALGFVGGLLVGEKLSNRIPAETPEPERPAKRR